MVPPITFFTTIRPFVGEFAKLQRLAIDSWLSAVEGAQVLVMGDELGVDDACADLGVAYLPGIATNEWGTKLFSAAFALAEQHASSDWLCEISADIVLGGDFALALRGLAGYVRPFVVGQRWDVTRGAEHTQSQLHPPSGVDYFLYRRGTIGEIPPFAVGCTAYDNWLVWAALRRWQMMVIDATETITAIHLNHGHPEYGDKAAMLQSEERAHNLELAAECERWYSIRDAPFIMRAGNVLLRKDA